HFLDLLEKIRLRDLLGPLWSYRDLPLFFVDGRDFDGSQLNEAVDVPPNGLIDIRNVLVVNGCPRVELWPAHFFDVQQYLQKCYLPVLDHSLPTRLQTIEKVV